jgi:hypothetical protein
MIIRHGEGLCSSQPTSLQKSRTHLQPRAVGLGLAGALLAKLMLVGTICIQPDGVMVADRTPPGNPH